MATASPLSRPKPSDLTNLLSNSNVAKTPQNSLAIQVLHNLQYQHSWTNLQLHLPGASSTNSPNSGANAAPPSSSPTPQTDALTITPGSTSLSVPMISGRPPKPLYIHLNVQAYMLKRNVKEMDIPVEVEWVLPMSLGEKWSLRRFAEVFGSIPKRDALDWVQTEENDMEEAVGPPSGQNGEKVETGKDEKSHKDAKRVLMAMVAHEGKGGDGTVVYYVMQEGDVKPRQN